MYDELRDRIQKLCSRRIWWTLNNGTVSIFELLPYTNSYVCVLMPLLSVERRSRSRSCSCPPFWIYQLFWKIDIISCCWSEMPVHIAWRFLFSAYLSIKHKTLKAVMVFRSGCRQVRSIMVRQFAKISVDGLFSHGIDDSQVACQFVWPDLPRGFRYNTLYDVFKFVGQGCCPLLLMAISRYLQRYFYSLPDLISTCY